MKWFKHLSNASQDQSLRRIRQDYGYNGLGIFWCITERVVQSDNTVSVDTLQNEFCSKRFSRNDVRNLIQNYGCFDLSEHGNVSVLLFAESPTSSPADVSQNTISSPADVPQITDAKAHTRKREEKEKNRKEKTSSKRTESSMTALLAGAADEKEKTFYENMMREYPNICTMRKPLTYVEMNRLLKRYDNTQVLSVLNDMDNMVDLGTRYISAYRTVIGWIDRRRSRGQS